MKRIIPILVILAIVAVVIGLIQNSSSQPDQLSSEMKVYTNPTHEFNLSYNPTFSVREYSPESVSVGTINGESIESVADVSVLILQPAASESFIDAAARTLIPMCAADGLTTSYSCTGVEQVQPIKTASGLEGQAFYLKGELTELGTSTRISIGRGPFFAFPVKSSATGSKVIVVHAPFNKNPDQVNSEAIRKIAESLQTEDTDTNATSIDTYVRNNISTLSPIKEQLGGKFYVTSFEAHGGAGTVSYEDGHNAYTADFTYSTDAAGIPSIQNFTVRQ